MGAATRWDIFEEHLDEAAFLHGQWEAALRSPDYQLAEIAAGPEERLLAHLDGLVLGGAPVAKRLLLPALGSEEAGAPFAAAFALVQGGRPGDLESVLAALEEGEPVQRAALCRALAVSPRTDLPARLAAIALKAPALREDLLEVLAYLRHDPGLPLEPLVRAGEPASEARALRLARVFPGRLDPAAVERGFGARAGEIRAAALETGAVFGMRGALDACAATVRAQGPGFGTAALLLALSGEEKWVAPLAAALGDAKLARVAAFALGFTGRVAAAEALLAAMRDEKLAPVAAEGLAAIAGLAVTRQFARPPKRWDPARPDEPDAGPGEEGGPESDLPRPAPEAIARWWQEVRPRLDAGRRWLRGNPWSTDAVLHELEHGPARRRQALALDVAVRTRGLVQLAWDAPAARQVAELAQARRGLGSARAPASGA